MAVVAVPLLILYEAGILVSTIFARRPVEAKAAA
jgi:Sec-independent protein secretion pathway component TatC